jgi:hypothetical protein
MWFIVCAKLTIGSKIVLYAPDGYSYVTRLKWLLVSFHLEIVLMFDARSVHGLHQTNHSLRNHFGHARWYS